MLPSGTNGTAGDTRSYALFGDFPQTIKASAVTVDETKTFTMGGNTYSSSSIQTYLTGSFLSSAFTSGSQNLISTTTVEGASGKIFLLSKTDAENSSYFSGDSSRIRNHTDFAVANVAENNAQNNGAGWWCRPGSVHRIALSVACLDQPYASVCFCEFLHVISFLGYIAIFVYKFYAAER